MHWDWVLIRNECTGCGICADVCDHQAIRMTRVMAYPAAVPAACVGCMDCVEQCPFEAVKVQQHGSRVSPDTR